MCPAARVAAPAGYVRGARVAATLRPALRRGAPSYAGPVDVTGDLGTYWRKVARAQDFHVRAVVSDPRDDAILLFKDAISRSGGDVLDFRTFSELELSVIVEVQGGRVLSLIDTLVASGWDVDVDPDGEVLRRFATALLDELEPILPDDRAAYFRP